jgi:hypothetical protein
MQVTLFALDLGGADGARRGRRPERTVRIVRAPGFGWHRGRPRGLARPCPNAAPALPQFTAAHLAAACARLEPPPN